MQTRLVGLLLLVMINAGCSDAPTPATPSPTTPVAATPVTPETNADAPAVSPTPEPQSPTHPTERIVLDFIAEIRNGKYATEIPVIDADVQLRPSNRVAAFRMLEQFLKTQEWRLWFTFVDVFEGNEDSVDCYLRGADGGLLLFMVAYHYDAQEWRIDAYEIPEVTFARPENETYDQYIARSVAEAKARSRPFQDGIDGDGLYVIEY